MIDEYGTNLVPRLPNFCDLGYNGLNQDQNINFGLIPTYYALICHIIEFIC